MRRALSFAAFALFVAGCLSFEVNFTSPTPTPSPTPSPDPSIVAADYACAKAMEPYASAVSIIWGKVADGLAYEVYVQSIRAVHTARFDAAAVPDPTEHCKAYRADLDEATGMFDELLAEWDVCRADGSCAEGQPVPSPQACYQQPATCAPIADFGDHLGWLWDNAEGPIDHARHRFAFPPPGLQ